MNIKNKQELNKEQEIAAFCEKNAVVAAGAGSGKTRVLANRFVWLLTEKGFEVDEILTLTFTRKAAAEMFTRIYALVLETAQTETGIKAQRAQKAIDDFIHARIQTLDSYCSSIVKQCAPRYGISPDYRIDRDGCKKLALEIAYPFYIAHRNHPAIERLYSVNSPNNIAGNIFADIIFEYCHIDNPLDFRADIEKQFNIICREWQTQIEGISSVINELENFYSDIPKMCPDLVPVMEKYVKNKTPFIQTSDLRKFFDELLNESEQTVIEKSEAHPIQEALESFCLLVSDLSDINLSKGSPRSNPVKDCIWQIRDLEKSISSLVVYCMQAGFIISIMSLLAELQDIYLMRKRTDGILDYKDIGKLAKNILIKEKDIRQSEKDAFKAIMIDEFQDNNELQKDILFLLAENINITNDGIPSAKDLNPEKLFFVGDEKQSIYHFRGADVSVFQKLKEEINSANITLKTNYRSAPDLIGAFNAIFGGSDFDSTGESKLAVFPSVFASSPSKPLFEAGYTTLKADKTEKGNLSICILNSHNDNKKETAETYLSSDENEARFVAEKIKSLLQEKTEDGNQKYKPNDIAILLRTGTPQHHFEKHLRFLGIPYACEKISNLFYGGLINDIISVLRLASYPMDSASYAEMLRSPFAGLSVSGTALCLSLFNGTPFNEEPQKKLDKYDLGKYLNGQNVYDSIIKNAKELNISSLVSDLWYNQGYRFETEWNMQTSVYSEMFDYLFHYASAADSKNQTLAEFTDSIIAARDSASELEEIDIPLERPEAVTIRSIHKSKGLEYPVVFLCCCGRTSLSDRCDIVYQSDSAGVVFSPPAPQKCHDFLRNKSNYFWNLASNEIKQKRIAELRRLLYVGMTRAENELYLTGSLKIKNNNDDCIDDFSLILSGYINEAIEKNDNYIEGDSIWSNNTFFGLFLPSVVSHIPLEGHKSKPSFFNLEEIPLLTEEYVKKHESINTGFKNDNTGLNKFLKKSEQYYKKAKVIKTPHLRNNHLQPVSLRRDEEDNTEETIGRSFVISKEFSGNQSCDVFNKVDSLLSRFSQKSEEANEKFNSGSFGTIAHICVEAHLNKEEPIIPSNISCLLTVQELQSLIDAGKELACRFVTSPMGKIAENAKLRECEFSFRSLIKNKQGNEVFINGTIDLFFEDNDVIHIIDFKTDSKELPGEHTAQMACYYQAISALFANPAKKQCRVWLYYLRTGHAVEMTEKAGQFNLEQRAFS